MSNTNYKEINCRDIEHLFNGDLILIVTATDLETKATHQKIRPLAGYDKIIRVFEGDLTYYFGMLGNYRIAHVQSSMGAISRDSSIMTVSTALKRLKSRIVIMVGIAFGVDEEKQNIGDVLLSESIIPYNPKRVGEKDQIQRGIEAPSSKILLNRFKNIKITWEYFLSEEVKAELIPTRLLSGEELIDNLEYRNELIKKNPDSKGGEMEGAGVYAACDGKADWIVVKGICDFADGKKGTDKEIKQTTAINSALSVCLEIFNSSSAFKELQVLPSDADQIEPIIAQTNVNDVLFDIYDSGKEPFYIVRKEDESFDKYLNQFCVWIYGPAGCGKSNLIIRNLIKSKRPFIQISLAACIGLKIESFFNEILYEIASKVEGVYSQVQPNSFSECSKALIELLCKHYKDKELIIFIEEIPISSEAYYKEFSERIFSLLISKNLAMGLSNIRFVLSSINNPVNYIHIFQHKIHQQLNFMSLEYWQKDKIISLIDVIEAGFRFSLPIEIKNDLIALSNGSPRFVKKYYRSIYTLNKTDDNTLRFILKDTHRELSHFKNE
jgi:nucleoside phosphorylase